MLVSSHVLRDTRLSDTFETDNEAIDPQKIYDWVTGKMIRKQKKKPKSKKQKRTRNKKQKQKKKKVKKTN